MKNIIIIALALVVLVMLWKLFVAVLGFIFQALFFGIVIVLCLWIYKKFLK